MTTQNSMRIDNRYEILEKSTWPSAPNLYKAKDLITNQTVLIKIWKNEKNISGNSDFFAFKMNQANNLIELEHPNVMTVYKFGKRGQLYYQVMEYIEGITLKKYIEKKGKLNNKEALSILIQMSYGMEAAHKLGIYHGDIRPANIMIAKVGKVKVSNWGLAEFYYEKWNLSKELQNEVMPDVHYMDPVFIVHQSSNDKLLDIKYDIYSMGMTLVEMLTGHNPYEAETDIFRIKELQEKESFLPLDLPKSAQTEAIELIVKKCCCASVEERYSEVDQLVNDAKMALLLLDMPFSVNDDEEENKKIEDAPKTVHVKTNDMLIDTLRRYEEFVLDRKLFKAYLQDSIPNEKQLQNNLLGSLEERIPQDMYKLTHISRYDFGRFSMRYSDAYGVSIERAEEIVATWIHALKIETDIQVIVNEDY